MWSKLNEWARALRREVVAVYLAIRDPRTPWHARWLGLAVVAYAFSPIDLVPDFVPVLGYLDDLLLVPLGIWLVVRLIPREILDDARGRVDDQLRLAKPVSWVGAAAIVATWVCAAVLVALGIARLIG